MKKSIKVLLIFTLGTIFGVSLLITYASSYNSEEISYDTSTSGAVQANVKDALDFLYNKTKSGASSECPENMSCVEKPGVTLNVSGPGTVDKGTVYVGLNESNTFTVTPNEGYVLGSITCDNGYILSNFKTNKNAASKNECEVAQTITITNPGTTNGAICSITFASYDIEVISASMPDKCNNNGTNCACWLIRNAGTNFTYGSHTGCVFVSSECHTDYRDLYCGIGQWTNGSYWSEGPNNYYGLACSAVIRCAT